MRPPSPEYKPATFINPVDIDFDFDLEGGNADRVAGSNCTVLVLVVENKREHTVEVVGGIGVKLGVLRGICCQICALLVMNQVLLLPEG